MRWNAFDWFLSDIKGWVTIDPSFVTILRLIQGHVTGREGQDVSRAASLFGNGAAAHLYRRAKFIPVHPTITARVYLHE